MIITLEAVRHGDLEELLNRHFSAMVQKALLHSSWGLKEIGRSEQILVAVQHRHQFFMRYGEILALLAVIGKVHGATIILQLLCNVIDLIFVYHDQLSTATLLGIHVGRPGAEDLIFITHSIVVFQLEGIVWALWFVLLIDVFENTGIDAKATHDAAASWTFQ